MTARIIADSVSNGTRIITMELEYHRFIHAECKTHRIVSGWDDEQYELVLKEDVSLMDDPMLSRNASSSRAIPTRKILKQVQHNPAMPVHWGKNQAGMQAKEEINCVQRAINEWKSAASDAIISVRSFQALGVHKQVANRVLEPFQFIKVIVTATEWEGFFKLRLHPDAQPEMQVLAKDMKDAMNASTPKELRPGQWHLPYITDEEIHYDETSYGMGVINTSENIRSLENAIKCSVAKCARVSYLNHNNSEPDVEKDIELADKLLEAGHMSCFEHQATPMGDDPCFLTEDFIYPRENWENGVTHMDRYSQAWSNNFRGWIQNRALIGGNYVCS